MGVFLFFTIFFSDLIVLVACGYEYKKYEQYRDGMILGVHIPKEALENSEVRQICERECRQRTLFQRVNHVLNLLICLLCIYRMELGMIVWFAWFAEYLIGLELVTNRPHKAMYQLKVKNQWLQEHSRKVIRVDTRAAAEAGRAAYSWCWHLLLAAVSAAEGILLWHHGGWLMEEGVGILLCIISTGIALLFLVLHIWIVEGRNIVYSQTSDVNLAVNRLVKHAWSQAFLSASVCNTLAGGFLGWRIWQKDWLGTADYVIYMILQLLGSIIFLADVLMMQNKKQQLLATDQELVLVDDDEYWKSGSYNNPDDRRILVPGRSSSASYTFNLGRRAGRVIYGGILFVTAAAFIWAFLVMFSLLNMKVTFAVKTEPAVQIRLAAADYTCTFAPEEVQSVRLIDSLPEDRFFKTNGSASDRYQVGHFKGKETGKAMMFLWKESTPILEIVLPDRTLYANSKDREETEEWYRQLKILFTNSENSFIIG